MKTVHRTPSLTLTPDTAAELERDFLLVPFFEDDDATDPALARVAGPDVEPARKRRELTGKLYEVFLSVVPDGSAGRRVAFVGAGARADFTADRLRRIAITGGLVARRARVTHVAFLARLTNRFDTSLAAQVIAEGLTIANFEGGSYKSDDEPCVLLESAEIRLTGAGEAEQSALAKGIVLGESTNVARELANGRIKGFDSMKIGPIDFNHDLQSNELKVTDAMFRAYRDFVTSDPNYKTSAAMVDRNRAFIELEMRFDLVTAAYGRVMGDRVFITSNDPQVAKAVDVLPKARDLAMGSARQ
jgi:hypothetical protein